jgi:sulfur-carrier protein adenylyltransferase/sulfurtransferase
VSHDAILQILDYARWAPSGDNTQPWRFEIRADDLILVHVRETRDLYDLGGWATRIAVGAMLENMRIAASSLDLALTFHRQESAEPGTLRLEVKFVPQRSAMPDPLLNAIRERTVHRRPLSTRALTPDLRQALERSVGDGYTIHWVHGWAGRAAMAQLLAINGNLRYGMYEGFEVHRRVIAPGQQFSEDRIPDQAVGLDPLARRLMAWALKDWRRLSFLNSYLGGTLLPTLELDALPGLFCASHALLAAKDVPRSPDDHIRAGHAVQRLWLTATSLGLMFQPQTTPLIFSWYSRDGVAFSRSERAIRKARALEPRLRRIFGGDAYERAVFMCRFGHGRKPTARSLRLPVEALLVKSAEHR